MRAQDGGFTVVAFLEGAFAILELLLDRLLAEILLAERKGAQIVELIPADDDAPDDGCRSGRPLYGGFRTVAHRDILPQVTNTLKFPAFISYFGFGNKSQTGHGNITNR